jgi:hypothetical protein
LGYVDTDAECCAFVGNYFSILNHGAYLIEEEAVKLKMLFMSDEDRKKQEIIMQNKRDMRAKMKADAAYKKELAELSMKERHAKG